MCERGGGKEVIVVGGRELGVDEHGRLRFWFRWCTWLRGICEVGGAGSCKVASDVTDEAKMWQLG